MLTSSSLFFLVTTLSTLHCTQATIVLVSSSKYQINKKEGQSLTLRCTTEYNKEKCGIVQVNWVMESVKREPLVDPDRYLISANESAPNMAEGLRIRTTDITFYKLNLNDNGRYQCSATCSKVGATAMGHFIPLNVTGEDQEALNRSDHYRPYLVFLMITIFILS